MARSVALVLLAAALLSAFASDSVRTVASAAAVAVAGRSPSSSSSSEEADAKNYLYKGDAAAADLIVEYTEEDGGGEGRNFDSKVDVPRVVEFYDPLCGACRALKPAYVKLAKEATKKRAAKRADLPPGIEFHAVSCRAHRTVCDAYAVNAYPTILALPAGKKGKEDAVKVKKSVANLGGYTLGSISSALQREVDAVDSAAGSSEGDAPAAAAEGRQGRAESLSRRKLLKKKTEEDEGEDDDDEADDDDDQTEEEEEAGNKPAAPPVKTSPYRKTVPKAAAEDGEEGGKTSPAVEESTSFRTVARREESEDDEAEEDAEEEEKTKVKTSFNRQRIGARVARGAEDDEDEDEEDSDADADVDADDERKVAPGRGAGPSGGAMNKPSRTFGGRGAAMEDESKEEGGRPGKVGRAAIARETGDSDELGAATATKRRAFNKPAGVGSLEKKEPAKAVPFNKLRKEEEDESDGDDDEDEDDDDDKEEKEKEEEKEDEEEPEESDEDEDEPPLPGPPQYPGQVRPGAVPNLVPNPARLAQTGMQPQDIERYQAAFAKRRADAAKRMAKQNNGGTPPFRPGGGRKRFGAGANAGKNAGGRDGMTPAEQAKMIEERRAKSQELLKKRVEMAKKIREQNKAKAASNEGGGRGVATSPDRKARPRATFPGSRQTGGATVNMPIGPPKRPVATNVLSKIPIVKRAVKTRPEEELYGDAALSFVSGLRMGVYNDDRPLDDKRQRALRDWLQLLSVSLPPELGLHVVLDDLLNNMNYISQSRANLFKQLDRHPLANKSWSDSCSKGRSGQGNNCGLWKLLHIMTVGFAEQRGGLELDVPDVRTFTPFEAAGVVREYVALFFGCAVCRNNFLSKYDDCYSFRRCDRMPDALGFDDVADEDWKEFPLWLWEFHNHISARIVQVKAKRDSAVGGKPRRDDEVIGVWPTLEECFMCYKEDGSWNMEELYHYLEKTYWHASVDFAKDRALEEYDYSTRVSGKSTSSFRSYAFFGLILLVLYAMKKRQAVLVSGFHKKFDAGFGASAAAGKKA